MLFPYKSPKRRCFMSRSMSQSSEEDTQMENRSKQGSAGCAAAGPVPWSEKQRKGGKMGSVTNDVMAECQSQWNFILAPHYSGAGSAPPAKAASALCLAYTPIYYLPFGLRLIFLGVNLATVLFMYFQLVCSSSCLTSHPCSLSPNLSYRGTIFLEWLGL